MTDENTTGTPANTEPTAPQPPSPYGTVPQPAAEPAATTPQPAAQPAATTSQPASPYEAPQPTQQQPTAAAPTTPYGYAVPQQAVPGSVPGVKPEGPGSGKGTGALICGILAILFSWTIIPGLILGIVAIVLASQSKKLDKPVGASTGKANGGLGTGIAGIVFSLLTGLFTLLIVVGMGAVASDPDFQAQLQKELEQDAQSSSSVSGSSSSSTSDSADKAAAEQAADDTLKELTQFSEEDKKAFLEGFSSTSGLDELAEYGIDGNEILDWLMSDTSYKVDSVSVLDDTAVVTATVKSHDITDLETNFTTAIDSIDAGTLNSEEDMKSALGQALKDAMANTPSTERTITFNVEKDSAGEWDTSLSEKSSLLDDIYGIY